ncbi:TIGR00282 family metallophosphoesterase [Elioraea tepidiphila]|uniref:TIGR00282 family metallophosphoesterase n=1 Tax=Elioraea tepidiphila TaxID=457934 RepID=UPI000368E61C|nr:TIGR00282 family metallophosphoesterase [Elioraea tepidiphila]
MKILFLGDVVGRTGRDAVIAALPSLRARLGAEFVIINAENAAHGFGLTPEIARALFAAGADVLTLGNHAWDRRELIPYIEGEPRLLRPFNYPPGTPGRGAGVFTAGVRKVLVVNAMGRLFMDALDCPFRGIDTLLAAHAIGRTVDAAVIDFHAEASSEKQSFGYHVDGRASLVVGTHTHVPTADAQILPRGTGYQSDAGMCGDYDSVIGMQKEGASLRFVKKLPGERLAPAEGEATICGVFVETDDATGLARRIAPVRQGGRLAPAMPE